MNAYITKWNCLKHQHILQLDEIKTVVSYTCLYENHERYLSERQYATDKQYSFRQQCLAATPKAYTSCYLAHFYFPVYVATRKTPLISILKINCLSQTMSITAMSSQTRHLTFCTKSGVEVFLFYFFLAAV